MEADPPGAEPDRPGPDADPPGADPAPVILVTATGRRVDTRVTTAALVVGFQDEGVHVAVTTPVRVGVAGRDAGLAPVVHLTGTHDVHETVRLREDRPVRAAAAAQGATLPPVIVHAARWATLARRPDLDVLVVDEPLGLATPLDEDGSSALDLIDAAVDLDLRVGVIVVVAGDQDDVRHACLITAALRARSIDVLGCVLDLSAAAPDKGTADQPSDDELVSGDAMAADVADDVADSAGVPLLGRIPAGAGRWDPQTFQDRAGAWVPVT